MKISNIVIFGLSLGIGIILFNLVFKKFIERRVWINLIKKELSK